ncbi:MAG: hypothetical protein ACRDVP_08450, partial [Acidimicrobiales bacterium]
AAYLTGRSFFPKLISGPFSNGLHEAFNFAAACCFVAAIASWTRGKKYLYTASPTPPLEDGTHSVLPLDAPARRSQPTPITLSTEHRRELTTARGGIDGAEMDGLGHEMPAEHDPSVVAHHNGQFESAWQPSVEPPHNGETRASGYEADGGSTDPSEGKLAPGR